jgi:hypothetical protein
MLVMLRARLSVASDFGNLANRPASSHGSLPSRANTETRLRVMPFASVPTGAKRNSFNPDCWKANASELGMFEFPQWRELISGTVVVETKCIALVTVLGPIRDPKGVI